MSSGGGGGGGGWMQMVSTIFTGMSTGLQAEGQMMAARTEREALDYNAKVQENEAQLEGEKSKIDIAEMRRNLVRTVGGQSAGYSASGVTATSGSAEDVMADTVSRGVLDEQLRQYQGDMKASGLRSQAVLNRYYGKQITRGARIGAAATKLAGISSAFGGSTPTGSKTTPSNNGQSFGGSQAGNANDIYGGGSGNYSEVSGWYY